MKLRYLIPILISLGTTITSSQATAAGGLTYDPCENYYRDSYGIDSNPTTSTITETKEDISLSDPNADYYKTYYGMYTQNLGNNTNAMNSKVVASLSNNDMANPLNYYKW